MSAIQRRVMRGGTRGYDNRPGAAGIGMATLGGVGTGASIGAMAGPIGAGIGAAVGGLGGLFSSAGSGEEVKAEPPKPEPQSVQTDSSALDRRAAQLQAPDRVTALRDAVLAANQLPQEQRMAYGPPLLKGLMLEIDGMGGQS